MTFNLSHEHVLDKIAEQILKADQPTLHALPSSEREALKAHVQGIVSTLSVGLVFLEGFEEIAQQGELASKVSAEFKQWVSQVPRNESGGRIAGMIAASICSVLEDYIVDLVPTKLTPTRISALRLTEPKLSLDDGKAREQLARRVKPSVRAKGSEWIAALNVVFSVSPTAEEVETLVDMITFRNEYIHKPPTAFARAIVGEHLKCWTLAAMILCNRLALC
jgi:hypothetical protein